MRGLPFVVLALSGCLDGGDSGPNTGDDGDVSPCVESLWFYDADGDGYGNAENTLLACEAGPGLVGNGSDCDDGDPLVQRPATWFADRDHDGFGAALAPTEACVRPTEAVDNDLDCDDTSPDVRPGAEERCNGVDDDCSGIVDGPDAVDARPFYVDVDGDGHAAVDASASVLDCELPEGYSDQRDDCDDADADAFPGASERCGGGDEDCDGTTADADAIDATTWYRDDDGDGFGGSISHTSCEAGDSWVAGDGDCDDADPDVHPDGTESCNGADDDCDGTTDEPYADLDFDTAVSGLSLNGDAVQTWSGSDGAIVLTDGADDTGTLFLGSTISESAWYAAFTFEASGGNSGEGLTFAFIDESDPTFLGNDDTGFGVEGATGWAVVLDTYRNSGDESRDDWLSIRDTADLTVLATGDAIPAVHGGGEQQIEVWFDAGEVTVAIDGTVYLAAVLDGPFPAAWQFGLTAATSAHYDIHTVDDLIVGCAP